MGLCKEETLLDSIPCVNSGGRFLVFLNEMSSCQFSKSTLLNLIQSAEGCDEVVFIVSRTQQEYYKFKRMFDVIQAERMTKTQIGPLVESN